MARILIKRGEISQYQQPQEKDGLFTSLGGVAQERVSKIGEIATSDAPLPKKILTGFGEVAGGIAEAGFKTAAASVSALTPDPIEQEAKKSAIELLQTPTGQKLLGAITAGEENYKLAKEANPEAFQLLESVLDISALYPIARGVQKTAKTASELAGATKRAPKAVSLLAESKFITNMQKDIEDLVKSKRSIENKVLGLEEGGTPIRDMLSERPIYEGLKVEKGTINPDKAIGLVDERIDRGLTVTKGLLPEMDKYIPDISKDVLRRKAYSEVAKQGLLQADEEDILRAIDKQIDAMSDMLKPSKIDEIRAKARNSSRTAKGQLKRNNEYAAIESAARDLVFESADQLPTATKGQFAELRTYIKQNIDLKTFLDETIRGQKVAGGRLGVYVGRGIGAVAGAQGGIFTSILGAEAGGKVASILMNNQLGSSVKLKLIREITDNPTVLKEAELFLGVQKAYVPPKLAPATSGIRSQQVGTRSIELPKKSATTLESEEMRRIQQRKLLNP